MPALKYKADQELKIAELNNKTQLETVQAFVQDHEQLVALLKDKGTTVNNYAAPELPAPAATPKPAAVAAPHPHHVVHHTTAAHKPTPIPCADATHPTTAPVTPNVSGGGAKLVQQH